MPRKACPHSGLKGNIEGVRPPSRLSVRPLCAPKLLPPLMGPGSRASACCLGHAAANARSSMGERSQARRRRAMFSSVDKSSAALARAVGACATPVGDDLRAERIRDGPHTDTRNRALSRTACRGTMSVAATPRDALGVDAACRQRTDHQSVISPQPPRLPRPSAPRCCARRSWTTQTISF